MKKLSKIVIITIIVIFIIQALYFIFIYENKRFNTAMPPTPKQLEDYESKYTNEKTK
ncbi:MAG: hypothetical protein PHI37_05390 [Candidatus Gracilibacteria bacterium]|nr:hypothetical protein [Candidatus Gracilibacteria bacterium]